MRKSTGSSRLSAFGAGSVSIETLNSSTMTGTLDSKEVDMQEEVEAQNAKEIGKAVAIAALSAIAIDLPKMGDGRV